MDFHMQYEDTIFYRRRLVRHLFGRQGLKVILYSIGLLMITSLLAFITGWQWIIYACAGIVAFALLLVVLLRVQFERVLVTPVKQLVDPTVHVTISEDCIMKENQQGRISIPWTSVTKVEETTDLLVITGTQVIFAFPSAILTKSIRSMIISNAPKYKGLKGIGHREH